MPTVRRKTSQSKRLLIGVQGNEIIDEEDEYKLKARTDPFTYDAEGNEILDEEEEDYKLKARNDPFTYDAEGNEILDEDEEEDYKLKARNDPFTYDAEGKEILDEDEEEDEYKVKVRAPKKKAKKAKL